MADPGGRLSGTRYRWRSCAGAYLSGVGVNAIAPIRGGDLVKMFLVHSRLKGSTYPTIVATLLAETLLDACIGLCLMAFALYLGVFPDVPSLPSRPAFEFSWLAAHPRLTLAGAAAAVVGGFFLYRYVAGHVRNFRERVRQGFTIFRTPRRYLTRVAVPQLIGWFFRVASAFQMLVAFGIEASVRNALLVLVVGAISTLLPLTPGGVGTQQGLIVLVLAGTASRGSLLAFSVGAQVTVTVTNGVVGLIALALMVRHFSPRRAIADARSSRDQGQSTGPAALDARRTWPARPEQPARKAVAPPLAGCRTAGAVVDAELGQRALRAAADRARSRAARRGDESASTSPPAASSATVGVRLLSGAPGWCGCAGTTFQSSARSSAPRSSSSPCTIVPDCSDQPSGRTLEGRRAGPSEQRALRRERDAAEAAAGVAHRLADQQQRRLRRALREIRAQLARRTAAPPGTSSSGTSAASIGKHAPKRRRGDLVDEARCAAGVQAATPASARRTAAASRSRTAASSPARSSSTGSGWPFTIDSKKTLRSP